MKGHNKRGIYTKGTFIPPYILHPHCAYMMMQDVRRAGALYMERGGVLMDRQEEKTKSMILHVK